jgi:hypothetical protein
MEVENARSFMFSLLGDSVTILETIVPVAGGEKMLQNLKNGAH